jgi:hypothetical protein
VAIFCHLVCVPCFGGGSSVVTGNGNHTKTDLVEVTMLSHESDGEHHDNQEQYIPHFWLAFLGCTLIAMIVGPAIFAGRRLDEDKNKEN